MPKLKILSGKDVLKMFEGFGFVVASQKGSHIKLRRLTKDNLKQTLTIPMHQELDRGTLKAIYSQALRYIPESKLRPHFFTE